MEVTFEGSRSYSHDNYPSQSYLARVDAAITPLAQVIQWLNVISGVLEDVA